MVTRLWKSWPPGLQLAVVGAVVFIGAAAGTWWVDDRSAFPEWLAAVATFAAFGAAALAARYAADVQRRESNRDRGRSREERRAQAALVAAWHERLDRDRAEGVLRRVFGVDVPGIWIRNASPLPVTDVRLRVYAHPGAGPVSDEEWEFIGSDWIQLIPPSSEAQFRPIVGDWRDTYEHVVGGWIKRGEVYSQDRLEHTFVVAVEMTFQDARGRRWRRDRGGVLGPEPDGVA